MTSVVFTEMTSPGFTSGSFVGTGEGEGIGGGSPKASQSDFGVGDGAGVDCCLVGLCAFARFCALVTDEAGMKTRVTRKTAVTRADTSSMRRLLRAMDHLSLVARLISHRRLHSNQYFFAHTPLAKVV